MSYQKPRLNRGGFVLFNFSFSFYTDRFCLTDDNPTGSQVSQCSFMIQK